MQPQNLSARPLSRTRRNSRSTPELASAGNAFTPETSPTEEVSEASTSQSIHATISGADMTMTADGKGGDALASIVVWYNVGVQVGAGQELGGARRRYREFLQLHRMLQQRYPRLLCEDTWGEHAALPPFPPKTIFRAGWEPEVVVARVNMLGVWLAAVTDKLQYVSPELISFLNVPMYCAVRMLSGDLSAADLVEPCSLPCSPDTVMAGELAAGAPASSPSRPPSSPLTDHLSLHAIASGLRNSLERPGYNESALYLARAICAHAAEAQLASPPPLDETHRLVRAICGRALFKPCSLIAAVVYLERIRPSMRRALLQSEGWALTALVVLVIAAKVYDSDYPISNADVCAPGLLPPHAAPSRTTAAAGGAPLALASMGSKPATPISMRRVNECERRVLGMLDYCTIVSQAEFARAYLTLPFAFPTVPGQRGGGGGGGGGSAGVADAASQLVPGSGASADCLRPVGGGSYIRKDSLRDMATRQLMGLSASVRQGSLP